MQGRKGPIKGKIRPKKDRSERLSGKTNRGKTRAKKRSGGGPKRGFLQKGNGKKEIETGKRRRGQHRGAKCTKTRYGRQKQKNKHKPCNRGGTLQ